MPTGGASGIISRSSPPVPPGAVLGRRDMPNAAWFPGTQVNYTKQIFRHVEAASKAGLPAVISWNEKGLHREISWGELNGSLRHWRCT